MVKIKVNIKEFLYLITFILMSNHIYNVVLVSGVQQSESIINCLQQKITAMYCYSICKSYTYDHSSTKGGRRD